MQKYGYLAKSYSGVDMELRVMRSAAGYYLGTSDHDGSPFSRESQEYWPTFEQASDALHSDEWAQKLNP